MEKELLRKVQLAQLEITREIRRVCEENDIPYFLDSGTLLGAVRHKGFIPWDDDMDLAMLREDYDRFCAIAPEKLGKDYFLQTWETDPHYPYAFAKIRKLGTVYVEASLEGTDAHKELFVDLCPFDHMPDDGWRRFWQGLELTLLKPTLWMKDGLTPWRSWNRPLRRFKSFAACLPFRLLALFCPRGWLIRRCEKVMRRYNDRPTGWIHEETGGTFYGGWKIPAACIGQTAPLTFEGELFACPEDSESYLRTIYGDYMQLPPESERENKHKVIEVKL